MSKKQKSKTKLKPQKTLGPTGYSLHAQRLSYLGYRNRETTKRAIKYPITNTNPTALENLASAIKHDYNVMNGAVNINCWQENPNSYSLIDLWLDTLRAGGFFCSKADELVFQLAKMKGSKAVEGVIKSIKKEFREKIDQEAFIKNIILGSGFRDPKNSTEKEKLANLNKKLLYLFAKEFREEPPVSKFSKDLAQKLLKLPSWEERRQAIYAAFGIPATVSKKNPLPKNKNKLTYYLDPKLKFESGGSPQYLMHRLSANKNEALALAGLSDNCNALSNFFNYFVPLLQEGRIEELKKELLGISALWNANDTELTRRLEFLSARAKELGAPKLQKSWAHYRTQFGGKLSSWYTNYLKRSEELKEIRKKHREALQGLEQLFTSAELKANEEQDKKRTAEAEEEAVFFTQSLLAILNTGELSISQNYNSYLLMLRHLRSNLNVLFQQTNLFAQEAEKIREKKRKSKKEAERGEEVYINEIPLVKPLFAKLKREPFFFGEAKKELFASFTKSGKTTHKAFELLADIEQSLLRLEKANIEKDYFAMQLDSLVRKYYSLNSNLYKSKIEKTILRYANDFPVLNRKTNRAEPVFYLSRYARRKDIKTVALADLPDYGAELDRLVSTFKDGHDWKKLTDEQLVDLAEITKVRTGWLLKRYCGELDFSKYDLTGFEAAQKLLETFGAELSGKKLAFLVQNCVASVLKGMVTLLTRKEIIVRSHLQPVDCAMAVLPLYVENTNGKLKFGFFAKTLAAPNGTRTKEVTIFKSKDDKIGAVEKLPAQSTFEIRSSKYQMQFLSWWHQGKAGNKIKLARNDPALVLEEKHNLNWGKEYLKPALRKVDTTVFAVLPFDLIPATHRSERLEKIKQRQLYLGIDVGEYGLGWVVADFKRHSGNAIVAKGFIYEPRIAKVREYRGLLKEQQVKGTFAITSTALARQREQAIGSLQSKIHALALKYNAVPVYEYQISNFETGSNRVSAVYRSAKRSDINADNEADRNYKKNIWGTAFFNFGREIGAFATSQTCSKCGKSVLNEVRKEQEYKLENKKDNIGTVALGEGKIKVFLKAEEYSAGDLIKGNLVQNLAYAYMRPPADALHLREKGVKLSELFLSRRGNSAVFVCPFCNHVSDADIQAALHIAFKRYLLDLVGGSEKPRPDFFSEMSNFVRRGKYPTVQFEKII